MSILRLVIAWLVMAALPLQGLAAASMLFCGQAAHSTVSDQAAHDHAAHGHDGGSHHHSSAADAGAGEQHAAGDPGDAGTTDEGHSCPICAACNLVALSESPAALVGGDSPASPPSQGPSRVITREAPAPDKPPRA